MKNSFRKMTTFDFLRLVHNKKIKWEDLNEDEQKTYNKFIINRALGFNNNMLDIVNRLQGYDVTPKESFKYYQSMTDNKFRFNKWIKGSKHLQLSEQKSMTSRKRDRRRTGKSTEENRQTAHPTTAARMVTHDEVWSTQTLTSPSHTQE